jgi:uncharacterized protein (DUF488 family)
LIYTIGHGALDQGQFVRLLRAAGISTLVDVRAFPASRRHPQFSRERLAAALAAEGIAYEWQGEALGGFRKGAGAAHPALRHPMFRAYAEHMESDAFVGAARALTGRAASEALCLMCAESDPANCHRSLISDWLVARQARVVHLLKDGTTRDHSLSPLAAVEGTRLVYRGAQGKLL